MLTFIPFLLRGIGVSVHKVIIGERRSQKAFSLNMSLIPSHITLLDNRGAISITIKIVVKLCFGEVKTLRYRTFSVALICC